MNEINDVIIDTECKFFSYALDDPYHLLENDIDIFNINKEFQSKLIKLIGKYIETKRR